VKSKLTSAQSTVRTQDYPLTAADTAIKHSSSAALHKNRKLKRQMATNGKGKGFGSMALRRPVSPLGHHFILSSQQTVLLAEKEPAHDR